MAARISGVSAAVPSFVSSTNLLRVPSVSSSRTLMKNEAWSEFKIRSQRYSGGVSGKVGLLFLLLFFHNEMLN